MILLLPPTRSWLFTRRVDPALKLVSAADLRPDGVPLAGEVLYPMGVGYPTGDGGALFWLERLDGRAVRSEWDLLRLPDSRIVARAYGFTHVLWLPGGKALGIVARQTPIVRVPLVGDYVDECVLRYWSLDWRSGAIAAADMRRMPAGERPVIVDSRKGPVAVPAFVLGNWTCVQPPPVPEACQVGERTIAFRRDGLPNVGRLEVISDGQTRTKVCTFPDDSFPVHAFCVTDRDTVMFLMNQGPHHATMAAFKVTVSTGRMVEIPLESTAATAAKP